MATYIWKYDSGTGTHDRVATLAEDGTVTGTSPTAERLQFVVDSIVKRNEDPADYYDDIRKRLVSNYATGHYRVSWD